MNYEPKQYNELLGLEGFSDDLLKHHFTLYQGYVTNTNKLISAIETAQKGGGAGSAEVAEMKRRFGWEFNGMRLHELYFDAMSKKPTRLDVAFKVNKAIEEQFGSFEVWETDFRSTGAMRGIGWVILYKDTLTGRLYNTWINEHDVGHLAGGQALLVMDVFEHAFMLDYDLNRGEYIDAFFKTIDWGVVDGRM